MSESKSNALTAGTVNTTPGRTLAEIKMSIQVCSRMAAQHILQIGRDLIEAKQVAGHGGWMPFLKDIGFSASTAENWMRLAREITPESSLARMPYSKALALLALPAEEREEFAQEIEAESKSAAEIKRLIEERNRVAEACNAETTRANEAEHRTQELSQQLDKAERSVEYYQAQAGQIEQERQAAERRAKALGQQLDDLLANPKVFIEKVEVAPADYEQMKQRLQWADQNVDDAMKAAMDAEQRAAQAEDELNRLRMEGAGQAKDDLALLSEAVNAFISATQLMAVNPGQLARREKDADAVIRRLSKHVIELQGAIGNAAYLAEGAVV